MTKGHADSPTLPKPKVDKSFDEFLTTLKSLFPDIVFSPARVFMWSPKQQTVFYKRSASDTASARWSLLHEVGHAILQHQDFKTDFELLLIEAAAWEKAKQLAQEVHIEIGEDHIQDCLDTYRDWLFERSSCPNCSNCSLQEDSRTYSCFNCHTIWHVSASRLCRPYRKQLKIAAK